MSEAPQLWALTRRHRRWGWSALALFVAMGLLLESLHGFKLGLYLDVANETRRLMWRLAHAHGSMIALVQLAFATQLLSASRAAANPRELQTWRRASGCLAFAQIALPLGFFAGGVNIHGGDPGLGVLLVPVGGLSLLVGVVIVARAQWAGPALAPEDPPL